MHAIIPAAGVGKRLRPQTWSVPKPLLHIAGKPILGHIMDDLIQAGVDHVTLITGYLGEMIVKWAVSTYPDIRLDFAVQDTVNGLASAVRLAEPFTDDGRTLVVLGDTLFSADLSTVVSSESNMIAVHRVEDPSRFGVVLMEDDKVTGLVEKPTEFIGDLAIVGVYSFISGSVLMDAARRLMEAGKKTSGEFQLTDAMQIMLQEGEPFGVFEVDGWFDCGKPETLLESNRLLLSRSGGSMKGVSLDSVIIPPVFIGEGSIVTESVVGPFVSLGRGAMVERSVLSDTIAGERVRLRNANLSGSILGSESEISVDPPSLNIGASGTVTI